MTHDTADHILARSDRGEHPSAIAKAVGVTPGRVYAVLREHRPERKRMPRPCTSNVPEKVWRLAAKDIKPGRIAALLGVSRQYVHRILGPANAER